MIREAFTEDSTRIRTPHSCSPSPVICSLEQFLQFLNSIYQFCNLQLMVCPQPDFDTILLIGLLCYSHGSGFTSEFLSKILFMTQNKTSTDDASLNTYVTQNREIQVNFQKYSGSFMFPVQEVFHWKMFNIYFLINQRNRGSSFINQAEIL